MMKKLSKTGKQATKRFTPMSPTGITATALDMPKAKKVRRKKPPKKV